MEDNSAIKLDGVTKMFKNHMVLHNISMDFEMGKIYGIVGRNGSGKTVLLKCICGLMDTTTGVISVNGKIVGKDMDFPENIGFIIENPGFLPHYSGFKNLKYLASIRGKIDDITIRKYMELVGLSPEDRKSVKHYSLGMKQRLGLAQALMENPDILILDEPMNALDNAGVDDMRNILLKIKEQGKLVILASHIRDDIQILCDEVYMIDSGNLLRHNVNKLNI